MVFNVGGGAWEGFVGDSGAGRHFVGRLKRRLCGGKWMRECLGHRFDRIEGVNEVGSVRMYVREIDVYSSSLHRPLSANLSICPFQRKLYSASCMHQLYVAQVVSQIIVSFVACICTRNGFVAGRRFSVAWEASLSSE